MRNSKVFNFIMAVREKFIFAIKCQSSARFISRDSFSPHSQLKTMAEKETAAVGRKCDL
jgi:hypothetical protein